MRKCLKLTILELLSRLLAKDTKLTKFKVDAAAVGRE